MVEAAGLVSMYCDQKTGKQQPLVTRSDALVPSSVLVTTNKALVTRSDALVTVASCCY